MTEPMLQSGDGLMPQHQRGAALVVAMLIVSLVTVFAASMMVEYNFGIRRVSNQIAAQQAYAYLRGTEAFAHKALSVDLQIDKDENLTIDHKGEIWAQEVQNFVHEDGAFNGTLTDLQGRFNLNSLRESGAFPADQLPPAIPYTVEQGIFIRLLQALGDQDFPIDETLAIAITEAVVDWLDADDQARGFNCGEDDAYYNIEGRQAHRTSNQPFASVSELLLICNMVPELYYRLYPHVTVWPKSGNSKININTASDPLLRSVLVAKADYTKLSQVNGKNSYQAPPPLGSDEIKPVLEDLEKGGYYEKLEQLELAMTDYKYWPNSPVGLYSNYFLLESWATMGDLRRTMSSVISREGGTIAVIARSTGGL